MLRETSQEKALRLAAVRPLEECKEIEARIRKAHLRTGHDPDGRPPRLERLVAYIRKHLFEGTLSVEGACKVVGIGDGGVGGELRAYIGFTVDELIDKLRIDTAFPLVAETGFSFGDIAHLVGFRTYRTFTRTFKIWVGEPPRKTRKRYRGGTEEPPVDLPVDIPFNFGDFRALRRVGEGAATPNDLERLRRALSELYPDTFGDRGPDLPETASMTIIDQPMDAGTFEKFQADRVVSALAELPFAEQRRYVRRCRSWTSALFDLLHKRSREEGRRDRQRGIELAQLALDSLDGTDGRLGERMHSLRAQGWAWLGNARRLALEFAAAESAFRQAEAMLQVPGGASDSFSHGILYRCKGAVRTAQRRYHDALYLLDNALRCFEAAGDISWQTRTLLQKVAVLFYRESYEDAMAPLARAEILSKEEGDRNLDYLVSYTSINVLVRLKQFELADSLIGELVTGSSQIAHPVWRLQAQWLHGNIDKGLGRLEAAEDKYLLVYRKLDTLDETIYAALLLLDLALLYAEAGRIEKVIEISPRICSVFEALRLYDETLASLQLLNSSPGPTESDLLDFRSALRRDPWLELHQGVRTKAPTP